MPGNSAGIVRAHRRISLAASQDTYTLPVMYASGAAPTATFVYPNDRYLPADVAGFTKFTFSVGQSGTVSGPSILFYYTNDPLTASGLLSFAGTGIWDLMAAPSDQSGTGAIANPVTIIGGSTGQYMQFFAPMLAYRIVSNAFTGGGNVLIDMVALP